MKEIILNSKGEPVYKDDKPELKLEYVKIAQEKKQELDEEEQEEIREFMKRVELMSIRDKKNRMKQPCHGEKYAKGITKTKTQAFLLGCGVMLAGSLGVKGLNYINTMDEYNRVLNQKKMETFTPTQLENLDELSNKEKLENYEEALASLDSNNYDAKGKKTTGDVSKYYKYDEDSILNLSEKQMDAIDIATDKEIEEIKSK